MPRRQICPPGTTSSSRIATTKEGARYRNILSVSAHSFPLPTMTVLSKAETDLLGVYESEVKRRSVALPASS